MAGSPFDLLDGVIGASAPVSAFMYPEPQSGAQPKRSDAFVFQYWPASLQVTPSVIYSEKQIPGGSHPLFNWVCGGGRNISFEAVFTAETDPTSLFTVGGFLSPSGRYTVNVAEALNRLQGYMMATYDRSSSGNGLNGVTKAPKRLKLCLPGTSLAGSHLGGIGTMDTVLVLLRESAITIEQWYPSGAPRVATVNLTFSETVQRNTSQGSGIAFIDGRRFDGAGYHYNGNVPQTAF